MTRPLRKQILVIRTQHLILGAQAYVLAEQWLTTLAVETVATELGVVCRYTVTDLELVDILHTSRQYVLGSLVSGSNQALTLPTAATTPTVSWPGMRGNLAINSPSWICCDPSQSVEKLRVACSECPLVGDAHLKNKKKASERILTKSVPHTPQAFTFTRTSFSRSSGRGTSTIEKFSGFEYLRKVWSETELDWYARYRKSVIACKTDRDPSSYRPLCPPPQTGH